MIKKVSSSSGLNTQAISLALIVLASITRAVFRVHS